MFFEDIACKNGKWQDQTFCGFTRPGLMAPVQAIIDFDYDSFTCDPTLSFTKNR